MADFLNLNQDKSMAMKTIEQNYAKNYAPETSKQTTTVQNPPHLLFAAEYDIGDGTLTLNPGYGGMRYSRSAIVRHALPRRVGGRRGISRRRRVTRVNAHLGGVTGGSDFPR